MTAQQLTVGELRHLIHDVPDDVVVGLEVPPSSMRSEQLTVYYAVEATYAGGPVLKLRPSIVPPRAE